MAAKFTCDKCGSEVMYYDDLYHVSILNGHNTAVMTYDTSPDLCLECATKVADYALETITEEVITPVEEPTEGV